MDLIAIDIGPLYSRLDKEDSGHPGKYGYIPRMAYTILGALNSEGFCERTLRAAGHVMTDGNTLLKSSKLEKLALLRINREFMFGVISTVDPQFFPAVISEIEHKRFVRGSVSE